MAIILDAVIAFFAAVGICSVIGMFWGMFEKCPPMTEETQETTNTEPEDNHAG